MIELIRRMGPFSIGEIWFSDEVYDKEDVAAIQFRNSTFTGDKKGFKKEASTTLVLDLTKSIEDIWNGMNKDCRYQIRLAKKDNIIVRFNQRFDEFYRMNQDFRKRRGLPPAFLSPEEIGKKYLLTTYELNGTLMGGHLCIKDDHTIRQLHSCNMKDLGGDLPRPSYGHGNRLAIWEMIQSVKDEGLVEFDFGGYATGKLGEELKGINKFKMSFGGRLSEKFSYYKAYSRSFRVAKSLYLGAIGAKEKIKALGGRH